MSDERTQAPSAIPTASQNDRDAAPARGRGRGQGERGRGGRNNNRRGGYGSAQGGDGASGAPPPASDRFDGLGDRTAGGDGGDGQQSRSQRGGGRGRNDRGPRRQYDGEDGGDGYSRGAPRRDEEAPRRANNGPPREDRDRRPPQQRDGDDAPPQRRQQNRGNYRGDDEDQQQRDDRPPRRYNNDRDDDRRPPRRDDYRDGDEGGRPVNNRRRGGGYNQRDDDYDDRPPRREGGGGGGWRDNGDDRGYDRRGGGGQPRRGGGGNWRDEEEQAPRGDQQDRRRRVREDQDDEQQDDRREPARQRRFNNNSAPAADDEDDRAPPPRQQEQRARRFPRDGDAEEVPEEDAQPPRRTESNDDSRPARRWADNGPRGGDDRDEYRRPARQQQQQQQQGNRRRTRPMRSPSQEKEIEAMFEKRHKQTGINFDKYENIPVDIGPKDIPPAKSFDDFQVHADLHANLQRCGYSNPTPVQKYGIPVTFAGKDIMACAQTGSGKTAAFLIPVVNHVLVRGVSLPVRRCIFPIAVIMAPTRELAAQIYDEARKLTFKTDVFPMVVYGGTDYSTQFAGVEHGADIIVATPGRLKDLFDRRRVSFERVKYLVLDEADRMLDMGFDEQIEYLVAGETTDMPDSSGRQTMLYSATFPKPIQHLARSYLKKDFYLLTVGRVGSTTTNITQRLAWCDDREKRTMLMKILCTQLQTDLVLVFVEKKASADNLLDYLNAEGIPCATIHGDRKQWEREAALSSFKAGETPVLVATDVAARGLDIPNVAHVIQYDLPSSMDDYIHRIGRTGRAGNVGTATSFFNDNNRQVAGELLAYLTDHEQSVPDWLEQTALEAASGGRRGGGGGRRGGGGRGGGGGGRGSTGPSAPPSSAGLPNLRDAPLVEDWEQLLDGGGSAPKKGGARRANASAGGAHDGGF